MLFVYLAVLISSAHARCACSATGGLCLYQGNGVSACDVPADSTCPDKYETQAFNWGEFYGYESKQACEGYSRKEGRSCFVDGCAGGTCMGNAIEKLVYKLADGNCYKAWEDCAGCLSDHGNRRDWLPTSCPKMECAVQGQPEGSSSFDCRGRCSSGFSCHKASGQCRSNPNKPQTSCVGTCASGYCCNKAQNRCDACSAEKAVGSCYSKCKREGGSQDHCTWYCGYNSEYSQAFTGASEPTFSAVHVFAAVGLGVVLYGSFRHYVK